MTKIRNNMSTSKAAVDKYIGTSYDVIKAVYDNLADIVTTAGAIDDGSIAETLFEIKTEAQLGSQAISRVFTFVDIDYVAGTNRLSVYRNGQRLILGDGYTETGTTQITLTFDPLPTEKFLFITNERTDTATEAPATTNVVHERITATAGQTVVNTTTQYTIGANNITVFRNGVLQTSPTEYTETTATSITFVNSLTLGDNVDVFIGLVLNPVDVVVSNYKEHQLGSAAVSRVFTLSKSYAVGTENLTVLLNGVELKLGTEYTETSNTSVTLTYDPLDNSEYTFKIGSTIPSTVTDAVSVSYTPSGAGAVTTNVQAKLRESVSVKDFGAVGDGVTDDTTALQAAIDHANSLDGYAELSLGGDQYKTTDELYMKTGVDLRDGTILFDPASGDKAAISFGKMDGSVLVRTASCYNVEVYTTSTQNDLVGFRFGPQSRANKVINCRAEMNSGNPTTADRRHIGYQIRTPHNDNLSVGGGNGAYQNRIEASSAIFAKTAFQAKTDDTADPGWEPHSNGNKIDITAFNCYTHAVELLEGAQENIVYCRADNFGNQVGSATEIAVVKVEGNFNQVEVWEEVGTRADTQYTVKYGNPAKYNFVKFHTQQVVTASTIDNTTGDYAGKNRTSELRDGLGTGSQTVVLNGYQALSTSANKEVIDYFVASRACLIRYVAAQNQSTPTSYTRLYFGKNGTYDTTNRVTWDNTDVPGTLKTKNGDPSASVAIQANLILAAGDYIGIVGDQDSSGGNTVRYTIEILYLE